MTEKRRATLKDIAERTGFSINTVSHALRGLPDISEETRVEIKRVAKQMGYVNNTLASSLRLGYTRTIAIIVPDISNLFFAYTVEQIEIFAAEQGYSTLLLNTSEDDVRERRAIRTALNKSVDGIIICPVQEGRENIDYMRNSGVPFVLFARNFPDYHADSVIGDDDSGAYQAIRYLLEMGHRDILFINMLARNSSAQLREAGFRRAFAEAGIPARPELIGSVNVKGRAYEVLLQEKLRAHPEITAIFAFNDMLAFGVSAWLIENGYRVPEDISVVGFDHTQSDLRSPFFLTSVDNNKNAIAMETVTLLLNRISGRYTGSAKSIVVPTTLAIGRTVKPRLPQ